MISTFFIFLLFSCATSFGVYHKVKKDETLYRISILYGTNVDKLKETNNIADETQLRVGEYLWIPDVKAPRKQNNSKVAHSKPKKGNVEIESGDKSVPAVSSSKFNWPAKGVVTSKFGKRWGKMHEGIDIGCPEGTPVFASSAGKVIFSGEKGGYGVVIIIQHPGEWFTIYAHNSKNLIKQGQSVKKGQKIAISGQTGRASGPHLHFEIRKGVKPVDPLKYLPKAAP